MRQGALDGAGVGASTCFCDCTEVALSYYRERLYCWGQGGACVALQALPGWASIPSPHARAPKHSPTVYGGEQSV